MATELRLIDSPSQLHRVKLGDKDYEILFMYNWSADRWTMRISENGAICPILAGRPVVDGKIDLLHGLGIDLGRCYCVIPSVVDLTQNWYDRMINGSGLLVFMTETEYQNLSNGIAEVVC